MHSLLSRVDALLGMETIGYTTVVTPPGGHPVLTGVTFGVPLHDLGVNTAVCSRLSRFMARSRGTIDAHLAAMHDLEKRVLCFAAPFAMTSTRWDNTRGCALVEQSKGARLALQFRELRVAAASGWAPFPSCSVVFDGARCRAWTNSTSSE